jgi:hypothetical protein
MNMLFKNVYTYRNTLFDSCVNEESNAFAGGSTVWNAYTARCFNKTRWCQTNFHNDHYGYSRCFIMPIDNNRAYNTWEQDFGQPSGITFHDFMHM